MFRHARFAALATLVVVAASHRSSAQCLDWHPFPRVAPALIERLDVLQVFDDGSGPRLYCGGLMRILTSATDYAPCQVATWDGAAFHAVSGPSGTEVFAMVTFDDGSGPALFVADNSGHVSKYQNSQWQTLGPGFGSIRTLAVHDDGSGPALYAGGSFTSIGPAAIRGVAKWNGSAWQGLASGPGDPFSNPTVLALASYDDGTGPALYAGGSFLGTVSTGSPNIAKWQGNAWSGVASGTNGIVSQLAVADTGSGPLLYAGGTFTSPVARIMSWDGTTWAALGSGFTLFPGTMQAFDVGGVQHLFVTGGTNNPFGTFPHLLTWDGAVWTDELAANGVGCGDSPASIRNLAMFDEGQGPHLIAATSTGTFGITASILARNEGSAWTRVGQPLQGLPYSVRCMTTFDDGTGPALIVGGAFCSADDQGADGVARWDGTHWHSVGQGLSGSNALTTYDDGTAPTLVAASNRVLERLIGSQWTMIGAAQGDFDAFLAVQQFGNWLYAGGSFTFPVLNVASPNLTRWSPSAGFAPVIANGQVNAMTTFDVGGGPALYVAGTFTTVGGTFASRVARFDGTSWMPLSSGMSSVVDALVGFDDGTGPALYAGGTFTNAGGAAASCVAKWNGTAWSALGAGLNAQVLSLEVFDDGSGPALYAGGNFSASGSVPMEHIAKWNGTNWSAVGGNVDGTVWTLKSFDDGTGPGAQLFAGGEFHHAGNLPSENFAAWRGCDSTAITKFCFGDGSDGACPCGNAGLPNRGCDNSAATGGARLNATGTTSPDTIVLHAGGELPNAPTLVFQGSSTLSQPILFGDGMRCVGGNLKRLFTTNAVGGAVNFPDATQMSISARSAMLGDPLVPGSVRSYQTWYRDPNVSFCAPPAGDAWNLSNAVRIVW